MAASPHFYFNNKELHENDKLSPDDVTNLPTVKNFAQQVDKIYTLALTNDSYKPGHPYAHFLRVNVGSDLSGTKLEPITLIEYRPPKPDKEYNYTISIFVQDGPYLGEKTGFTHADAFDKIAAAVKLTPVSQTHFVIGPKGLVEQPASPVTKPKPDGPVVKFGDVPIVAGQTYTISQLSKPLQIHNFTWEPNSYYAAEWYDRTDSNMTNRTTYKLWMDISTDDKGNIKAGPLLIDYPIEPNKKTTLSLFKLRGPYPGILDELRDPTTAHLKLVDSSLANKNYFVRVYNVEFNSGPAETSSKPLEQPSSSVSVPVIKFGDVTIVAGQTYTLSQLNKPLRIEGIKWVPNTYYIAEWYDRTDSSGKIRTVYKLWVNISVDADGNVNAGPLLIDNPVEPNRKTAVNLIHIKNPYPGNTDELKDPATAHSKIVQWINSGGAGNHNLFYQNEFYSGPEEVDISSVSTSTAKSPYPEKFPPAKSGGYFQFGKGGTAVIKDGATFTYDQAQQPITFNETLPYKPGKYYIISLMSSIPNSTTLKRDHHIFMIDRGLDDTQKFDYITRTSPKPVRPTKYTLSVWEQPHGAIPKVETVPSDRADIFKLFPDMTVGYTVYEAEFTVSGPAKSPPVAPTPQPTPSEPVTESKPTASLPPCDCSLCKSRT